MSSGCEGAILVALSGTPASRRCQVGVAPYTAPARRCRGSSHVEFDERLLHGRYAVRCDGRGEAVVDDHQVVHARSHTSGRQHEVSAIHRVNDVGCDALCDLAVDAGYFLVTNFPLSTSRIVPRCRRDAVWSSACSIAAIGKPIFGVELSGEVALLARCMMLRALEEAMPAAADCTTLSMASR